MHPDDTPRAERDPVDARPGTLSRLLGMPGDRWSLARAYGAMVLATLVGAGVGLLFDLAIGPLIGQGGWWTVFALSGTIVGATAAGVREFATPIGGPVYAPVPPAPAEPSPPDDGDESGT